MFEFFVDLRFVIIQTVWSVYKRCDLDMEFPTITALLAALFIVLQQVLMLSAGMHRAKTGQGVGIGEDQQLERKVRRHGNHAENAAILLVVLALVEMFGAPSLVVLIFAVVFALSRVFHAIGFGNLAGSHDPSHPNKTWLALRAMGAFGSAIGGIAIGCYLAFLVLIE